MKTHANVKKNINRLFSPSCIVLIFLIVAISDIYLPGVYMDSVNPDYLATYMLHPDKVPAWIYPDNILAGIYRFPILNSLYGAALPAYIGLGVWKIIGYSIFSVRILHITYGIIVLLMFYKLIEKNTNSRILASISTLVLGLDPTFVFVWRTQFYLQLFPLITFIPALKLICEEVYNLKYDLSKVNEKKMILGAFLLGVSAMGYFIFAIYFIMIILLFIYLIYKKNIKVLKTIKLIGFPFIVGYLPYIYAHMSIIIFEGINGYVEKLKTMSSAYGITTNNEVGILDKVNYTWSLMNNLSGGEVVSITMTGRTIDTILSSVLLVLCILVTIIFIVMKKMNKKIFIGYIEKILIISEVSIGIIGIHFIVGITIGNALGFQHYITLLPIIYICLTASLKGIHSLAMPFIKSNIRSIIDKFIIIILIFVLISNIIASRSINKNLNKTGGSGYYSDSINRLADFTYNMIDDSVIIFPQWGYWMGVAILTGGEKEIWNDIEIENIITRINNSPRRQAYYIVTDQTNEKDLVDGIEAASGLTVTEINKFYTREGELSLTVECLEWGE